MKKSLKKSKKNMKRSMKKSKPKSLLNKLQLDGTTTTINDKVIGLKNIENCPICKNLFEK